MGAPTPCLGSFHRALEQKSNERHHLLSSPKGPKTGCFDNDFEDDGRRCQIFCVAVPCVGSLWKMGKGLVKEGLAFGQSDPRKVIFAGKMGLAFALMSALIFFSEVEIGQGAVWAILTVIVVFEFTVGKLASIFYLLCFNTLNLHPMLNSNDLLESGMDTQKVFSLRSRLI